MLEGSADGKTDMLGDMLTATLGFVLVNSDGAADVELGIVDGALESVG
jgi:hypothetical protein